MLVIPPAALIFYLEFFSSRSHSPATVVTNVFYTDYFSIIMALIVSIIGGLVSIYALHYMREYHRHHPEVRDRSNVFFSVFFLFFSAMFGIIFSNNLRWMFFFWEVTSLASFILIGYPGTPEATKNAARALFFNLLGGVAFASGIGIAFLKDGITGFQELIAAGKAVALIPAVLLTFAGMTKSAQLPFSSWLKGAMVAPTPVSALLHSSTMVKAGVFVIIKLSPLFSGTVPGFLIALIGACTFLFAAFIAVSRRDAKEVLAYSTVSNLGLIVLCAGVGTPEAIWAAILLLIFHAIAKALLFLSVGLIEHRIGSRDIEAMDGLLRRMPRVTYLLLVGIAGMFLAPFGMLISKWAALKALVDAYLSAVYGKVFSMDQGNILIMLIMLGLLILLPVFLMISITRGRYKMEYFYTDAYLSGTNTRKPFKFYASRGLVKTIETQNYYMENLFGEKRLFRIGVALTLLAGLGGSLAL